MAKKKSNNKKRAQPTYDNLINLAEKAFNSNNLSKAISKFKKALQLHPDDASLHNNLGVIYFKQGSYEKAKDCFEKAVQFDNLYFDPLYNLAKVCIKLDQDGEALQYLQKCLRHQPDDKKVKQLASDVQLKRDSVPLLTPGANQKTDTPLNILFVQEAPCIRNYKMAKALCSYGHRVSLAYTKARLSQMYKGLSDDVYIECIKLENHRQLWDISKNYDILHCHNEPDVLTVAALAGDTPVVHDTHDLISLRENGDPNICFFEGVANRGAHGRVYTTPYQMDEAKQLYDIDNASMVFYNYVSEDDLPRQTLPKLSDQDGQVHIVYEGGMGGTPHRDFGLLFQDLSEKGIHVHIYPTKYNDEIAAVLARFPLIHYHPSLSPRDIIQEMTQYDFGIIPFNLERGNKRFLDSTIANKLFEYLAAGLPVMASRLRSYEAYFQKNPVGMVFDNAQDLIEKIPRLREAESAIDFSQQVHTIEGEIDRLEVFYTKILKDELRKSKSISGAGSSNSIPCPLCDHQECEMKSRVEPFDLLYCPSCELHFLDPMPTDDWLRQWYSEEEKKKRWNGDLSRAIEANHAQNEETYPQYFDFASENLNMDGQGKVLEIGCYSGLFLKRFVDLEYTCEGIDLNEGFVRYGREKYQLNLKAGTVFDQRYPDNYFDLIIFHQVMEHLNDPTAFLMEVRRIVKNDGTIFLSVPNTGSFIHRMEGRKDALANPPSFLDVPNHLFYFTKRTIRTLLKITGFDIQVTQTFLGKAKKNLLIKHLKDSQTPDDKLFDGPVEKLVDYIDDGSGLMVIAKKRLKEVKDTSFNSNEPPQKTSSAIPREVILHQSLKRPLLDLNKTQWLSTEQLQSIQDVFLQMLIREVYEKVPYYRQRMDEAGIDPNLVDCIQDLAPLGIIDKSTFHRFGNQMRHSDFDGLQKHATATGGSTGQILKYYVTPEVYYYGFRCRDRGFRWAGFDPGKDRIAYLAGGSLGVTDKIVCEKNTLKIPATGITSRDVLEKYYHALKDFKPQVMRAYPSALTLFCQFLQESGKKLTLKSVITTAEMLYPHQRRFMEEALNCQVFNEYGTYDGGAGAFECEQHSGLHLQMERGLVEVLDDEGNPVQPGESGRVVVTDLHNYIVPFIRYDVGDRAVRSDRQCSCGRGLQLIEKIEGRSSDYILLEDGTKISGEAVIHLFNKMLQENKIDIQQYQVLQKKNRSLEIRILPSNQIQNGYNEIITQTFETHFPKLSIDVQTVNENLRTAGGKMRFVVSELEANKVDVPIIKISSKKEKPKICHIGGAHSVHVADIVEELDQRGYEQCILSYYPVEESITPSHIPVHHFPFRDYGSPDWKRLNLEKLLEKFLGTVLKKEKPDIVQGHSLTYSCIPVWMAKTKFGLPTLVIPWSTNTIKKPDKIANYYEKLCIQSCDYFLHSIPGVFKIFQSYYGNVPDEKYIFFRPLVDLSHYKSKRKVSSKPKILAARVMGDSYRQDYLVKALPTLLDRNPELEVTLIIGQNPDQGRAYFNKMIELSKTLRVYESCNFIDERLSQAEFAELIKSHNIIYAPAVHDSGFSGTALQAMYSGAIVISQDTPETKEILVHEKNLLKTKMDEASVINILLYSLDNFESLQKRFIEENKKLSIYDKKNMINNLVESYHELSIESN